MAGEGMKAAGKLTGVPVIPAGVRGLAAEHLPMSSSVRMPVSVLPAADAAPVSSGDEGAGELMPRVVFHGAPTLEEAREATSELIVGIEKLYPCSHDSDEYENSNTAKTAPPTTVFKAFKLLRESPAVQDVVTSLACDQNVLKAVRENLELQEFLHSQKKSWASSNSVFGAEKLDMLPAKNIENSSNHAESKSGFCFEDFLKIFKVIADPMKNFSDIFNNLFGGQGGKSFAKGDENPGAGAEDVLIIQTSLLGLVIMVIMLIFFKRV